MPTSSKDTTSSSRNKLSPITLFYAGLVALLAAGNYIGWIHNYFVADSWALIGSISEPDWSIADLLPFRQVPHRINSTFYYSPVYTAILWLTYKIGGFSPERYHLILIGFHVGTTLCLFTAALQLTGSYLKATIAGAIFATHFASTEAIGWIGAITHPVAGFFGALSLALYVRYLVTRRLRWIGAAFAALAAAAFTQVTALPWFAILACLDVYYCRKSNDWKGIIRRIILLGALLAAILLLQLPTVRLSNSGDYNYQLGPWVVRNLFFYPLSTVIPMLEGPSYSLTRDLVLGPVQEDAFIRLMGMNDAYNLLLACGLMLVLVAALWAKGGRLTRFSVVAFVLGIAPCILLNGHGYRYLYVSLVFFSIILSSTIVDLYRYLRKSSTLAAYAVLAIIPFFVILSVAESQRQLFWWQQAGFVAHKSLLQLKEMQPLLPDGAKVVFGGLPDTLQNTNAQVWRNGIYEAVRIVYNDRSLRVEAYTKEEAERLFREELKDAHNTYGFVWENWQLKRIAH